MSAAAATEFAEWREQYVSQERGSRVVHYFLEDGDGKSWLAVVGRERSLRHMVYVVAEEFCREFGFGKLGAAPTLKWRSRREVVDWLASFLATKPASRSADDGDQSIHRSESNGGYPVNSQLFSSRSLGPKEDSKSGDFPNFSTSTEAKSNLHGSTNDAIYQNTNNRHLSSDITWSDASWTCSKQLRHFRSFSRNGTTITMNSFVLVLSDEDGRHLAYLEDMYEDKKGQKKVRVRWFHRNKELTCRIPPPVPHACEVFFTPYSQVISVECVDDIATVLTPEHFDEYIHLLPPLSSLATPRMCFRQFSKNRFKHFDLRKLQGYFNQPALLYLRSVSRQRQLQQPPLSPYKVGDKVEVLCQDSGIRGCWFSCTVLEVVHRRLKVRYDDLSDADDDDRSLEEWVPAFRLAAEDKLGMRYSGRPTVRPCPTWTPLPTDSAVLLGTPVDVWWNDGWWEGVCVSPADVCMDNHDDNVDGGFQVYFPGEDLLLTCQRKNARVSKDWGRNMWLDIDQKPDILSRIVSIKATESGGSAMSDDQRPIVSSSDWPNKRIRAEN